MTEYTSTSRRPRRRPQPESGVSEQAATPVLEVKPQVLPVAAPPVKAPEAPAIRTARLASAWPGTLRVRSAPSGSMYEWRKAGDIVQVLESDLAHLLAKNRNDAHGCCGSSGPRIYFVLV